VPVAHDMKSDTLALVLASMNSETAKSLTVKLADRLTLPQTTPPAPAAPVAEAAAAPAAAPPAQASAAKTAAPPAPENPVKPKG